MQIWGERERERTEVCISKLDRNSRVMFKKGKKKNKNKTITASVYIFTTFEALYEVELSIIE